MVLNMNFKRLLGNYKVQLTLLAIVLSIVLIARGLNYGIEFKGGVRIPIVLEKAVDSQTMELIVGTIKTRINKFGLSQSVVRAVGNKEIIVEIPKADESVVKSVEKILKEQGKFQAIIDGKEALGGGDIIQSSVGGAQGERVTQVEGGYRWELDFVATKEGGEKFALAAKGKGNYPVYMFLDRPENASSVVVQRSWIPTGSEKDALDAIKLEGSYINVVYSDALNESSAKLAASTKVIVAQNDSSSIAFLKSMGFSETSEANGNGGGGKQLVLKAEEEVKPVFSGGLLGKQTLSSWKAIGLLSSPILSPSLANGRSNQFYQITGPGTGSTPDVQKASAAKEIRELKSVISGGKLPVSTQIGSTFSVPPSLGEQFLSYSWIGVFLASLAVALVMVARYKKWILILPIVFIGFTEVLFTAAVIGTLGTLDLAGMAGIISLMGTGVDDQIIVTDEILRGQKEETTKASVREKIVRAFTIIFTTAGIAIVTMLPLFLSGIVEIMGFALSTIIGVLFGVIVTRPAFADILEEAFREKQ
jgi:preprotein translocase subunit SecD